MPAPTESQAITRSRRHRERKRRGAYVVQVEVNEAVVRKLVVDGWIKARKNGEEIRVSRQVISEALGTMLQEWSNDVR